MTGLHFLHSGLVNKSTLLNSHISLSFFVFLLEFVLLALFSLSDDPCLLSFVFFEPKHTDLEGSFMCLLEDEVLDRGVVSTLVLSIVCHLLVDK